jgi:putative hydrolase of the HAD superfamily
MTAIKGLLLDYGGTIDTNGVHWGEVLWNAYQKFEVPVDREAFRLAYAHGERTLALQPLVKPHHIFHEVLQLKVRLQLEYLHLGGALNDSVDREALVQAIAAYCNDYAAACIQKAVPVLDELGGRFPLVLVSNFYGNVEAVLRSFGIRHYFKAIVESSVVGYRKPDPALFSLGVQAQGLEAGECVVIGDSYIKDIVPGKQAGCATIC